MTNSLHRIHEAPILLCRDRTAVRADTPETWEPQAMFFIGVAAEEAKGKTVRPVEEVVQN